MFKQLMILCVDHTWAPEPQVMEDALRAKAYVACGPTQEQAIGWVPPRGGEHDPLLESINGHRLMRLRIERKSVSGTALKRRLNDRLKEIEAAEGRKPGRKESRDIRDEIHQAMLPNAESRISDVLVWHDLSRGHLVLDASNMSKADAVITHLVQTFDEIRLCAISTKVSPQAAMSNWLTSTHEDWPDGLTVGRDASLKSSDEMSSSVRFSRHHLDQEVMKTHIAQGKLPTMLGLEWDGRISFQLTDALVIKKVQFLDGVSADESKNSQDHFDTDVVLSTSELGGLLDALIPALGGKQD